jgi:kynurenine formamidase
VTLAAPLAGSAPDNPEPGARHMKRLPGEPSDVPGLAFAADQLVMNMHGDADSHLDALCHVSYEGRLYNGVLPGAVTSQGAAELSVDDARDGIAGRGVLLDIPRLREVPWLEPGDQVTTADLTAAAAAQRAEVGPGDLLLVRVGHRRRRNELGPWDAARSRAGLDPRAVEFLAEREVAALGCDGNSDTAPSTVDGVGFPVHVLAINALGMHLLDYLQFEDLAGACEAAGRWSFLCVIAPLRLPGGTGSPVNPIAIL